MRDQILACRDLRQEKVKVPEWGCDVWVRNWTVKERDLIASWHSALVDADAKQTALFTGKLVAFSVVDENGERVFRDEDAEALEGKNAEVLDRICKAALALNGLAGAEKKS